MLRVDVYVSHCSWRPRSLLTRGRRKFTSGQLESFEGGRLNEVSHQRRPKTPPCRPAQSLSLLQHCIMQ